MSTVRSNQSIGHLEYRLRVTPAYTLAMYVSSLAPTPRRSVSPQLVRELVVANVGSERSDAHPLALRVAGRIAGEWVRVPQLAPGESRTLEIGNQPSAVLKSLLEEQTSPAIVPVQLFRGSSSVAQDQLLLLNPRSWLNIREQRCLIAAFVTPDEREVVDLVAGSLATLPEPPAHGDAARRAEHVREALRRLYDHVQSKFQIRYRKPRQLERDPRTGHTYQAISEIDDVLIDGHFGGATCLDLSVLFAACIEQMNVSMPRVQISPWIVFTGTASHASGHSFVGCRLGGPGPFELVDDVGKIRTDAAGGRLVVWEPTGVCREPRSMCSTFDQAVSSALATLSSCDVHAVDVGACRIGHAGGIPPLPPAPRPVVTRAFSRARRMQTELGLRNLDATLVLFALTFEPGTKLEAVLEGVGSSRQALRSVLSERTGAREGDGVHGGPTRNHRLLWEDSFSIASSMGRRSPRESDLLWAFSWSRSRVLREMLAAVGLPEGVYEAELARVCPEPPPDEATHTSWR